MPQAAGRDEGQTGSTHVHIQRCRQAHPKDKVRTRSKTIGGDVCALHDHVTEKRMLIVKTS